MTYPTEDMISMMENLRDQANDMERHVKNMIEAQGRACGIELDKRKNARDLMEELHEHQVNEGMCMENGHPENQQEMMWAYVPNTEVHYDTAVDPDYHPGDYQEMNILDEDDEWEDDDDYEDWEDDEDHAMPDDGVK